MREELSIESGTTAAPVRVVTCGLSAASDISLLHCDQYLGAPVRCRPVTAAGAAFVRGAACGVDTRLVTLRARLSGLEQTREGDYLDLAVAELGQLERDMLEPTDSISSAYAALRGLSGGPVGIAGEDGEIVCGMVCRRNTAGICNRLYAMPLRNIVEFLRSRQHILQITRAPEHRDSSLDLLAGRLIARIAASADGLHQLWEDMSELFYGGVAMDSLLRDILSRPAHYSLREPWQLIAVRYLLARLLNKRGEPESALTTLGAARQMLPRTTDEHTARLKAAIDLRLTVGLLPKHDAATRQERLLRAVGEYETAEAIPEDFRAYEIASVLGGEATALGSLPALRDSSQPARRHFEDLQMRHRRLLDEYPHVLIEKQEIVSLGLDAVSLLFGLNPNAFGTTGAVLLSEVAARGRMAAIQRGNGIFLAQMTLLQAIAAKERKALDYSYRALVAVARALQEAGIGLRHEGIAAYMSYLDGNEPELSTLFRAVYNWGIDDTSNAVRNTRIVLPPGDLTAAREALRSTGETRSDQGLMSLLAVVE
ncbi:hypothetical protein ACFYTQ_30905 [Nocardia sp. NPDC004068]|uniref:hypothetical protein n=1 Tax=Nocardia sp. NPDC004068 TaxID=3364303 RepID=UPI0036A2178B